ncbi:Kinesin-4 [Acorus calamus]|uniref:Kinesin-4 n=1 Tax=Acorus calamus TaxID=4465 RepID=A0AAV9CZ93_ACOCL|nr:Kinesin-4 [Acorus calamus]
MSSLTRITIVQSGSAEKGKAVVSRLWLVDLGGSERLLKTGAVGLTLDEGRAINLSLSALGDVIAALKMRRKHIPYRNSKLTQILRNSLGEGSKVLMLVHISPSENDVAETICSLNFANRARAVEPNKELSEDLKRQKEKSVTILENQMKEIEVELDEVRNQITNIEYLVQEKKKLFSVAYWILEDQKGSPRSPLLDNGEVVGSPRTTEKSIHKTNANPLPRFMTSTACSRQRKNASVEAIGRVRPPRQIYRSSMDLYGSQSLSYDMSFRSNSHMSKSKSTLSDAHKVKTRNSKGLDLKMPVPTPRDGRVCVSHPNLRGVLNLHRRRMSDFT